MGKYKDPRIKEGRRVSSQSEHTATRTEKSAPNLQ
jgi:hypothetical protein